MNTSIITMTMKSVNTSITTMIMKNMNMSITTTIMKNMSMSTIIMMESAAAAVDTIITTIMRVIIMQMRYSQAG